MTQLDDEVLQDLYSWVDYIPMSRPKRNIARDFSDGLMMAELVKHYFPRLVELHNYPQCHALLQKKQNWALLNLRVFKRLNFELSEDVIDNIIHCKPGTIERVLLLMRTKMDRSLYDRNRRSDRPEAEQGFSSSRSPKDGGGKSTTHFPPIVPPSRSPRNALLDNGIKKYDSQPQLLESDYVSRLIYEQKVQECMAKDETIEILQAKVRRLEHLIHLKDVRIDELQSRIQDYSPDFAQPLSEAGSKHSVPPQG